MPDLHLLRLSIDPAGLARFARMLKIGDEDDHGYRLHALFAGLWGDDMPAPWLFDQARQGPDLTVWGYATRPWDELRQLAQYRCRDPRSADIDERLPNQMQAALAWDACASKPMPALAAGRRLGFDLRACATIRLSRDLPGIPANAEHGAVVSRKAGDEVDAWTAEALRRSLSGQPVHMGDIDPVEIYRGWLSAALGRLGGFTIDELRICGHRRVSVLRKDHARGGRRETQLPEVHASGTCRVTDPAAFATALARGVGRHRAFGFGMMLLRPADG